MKRTNLRLGVSKILASEHNMLVLLGSGASILVVVLAFLSTKPIIGPAPLLITIAFILVVVATKSATFAVSAAVTVGLSAGASRRILTYLYPDAAGIEYIVLLPSLLLIIGLLTPSGSESRKPPLSWVLLAVAVVLAGVSPAGAGIVQNILTSSLLLVSVAAFLLTFRSKVNFEAVVNIVIIIGSVNAIAMLLQHDYGLSPWDSYWVDTKGYPALYLGPGEVRPLGIASSAAESAALSAFTAILSVQRAIKGHGGRRLLFAVLAGLAFLAVLYSGTRTFLILSLIAFVAALVAGRRNPKTKLIVAAVILTPLTMFIARLGLGSESAGAARTLTTLAGQEDLANSTIPIHLELLTQGVARGLASVVGSGSGQLSVLAEQSQNAEVDIANLALMAGVVGFAAAIALYIAFLRGVNVALISGRALPAVVVLICTLGQWTSVGFYGVTMIIWLAFGDLARQRDGGSDGEALVSDRKRRSPGRAGWAEPIRVGAS